MISPSVNLSSINKNRSNIGFDNIPEASFHLPTGLTRVDQSVRQMGVVATEMLVNLIKGDGVAQSITKFQPS
jgi:DNA-binding LacI/PurR family transcriptional regulator